MHYKLKVTKYEDNKEFQAEMEQWRGQMKEFQRPYNHMDAPGPQPEKLSPVDQMEVIVTEEQWQAIQKSVLETFK